MSMLIAVSTPNPSYMHAHSTSSSSLASSVSLSFVLVQQVEPFLLAPQGANLRERDRRKELMRQRMVQIKLGVQEDDLPQQLQLSYIK